MSEQSSIDRIDPVRVAERIQDEPIDPALIAAAGDRVRERLRQSASTAAPDVIEGCADFARLIPAFVAGELAEARRLLVEDHTRSCVPCRRVLMAERSRDIAAPKTDERRPARSGHTYGQLAIAAAVLLAVAAGVWLGLRNRPLAGELARVESVDGLVLLPEGQSVRPAAAGTVLASADMLRTGRGSRAVVMLADGSRVEMGERSELAVSGRGDGLTVRLGRGQVIVEAAKQSDGRHLAIATADCEVTVVGTVFSVAHGTRGSRVSVLEGEVKVASGSQTRSLRPGDQTSTAAGSRPVPIRSEIAWSERSQRYLALLGELDSFRRELNRALPASDARHGTRLLDAAPAGTVVYAAIPNASGDLLTSYRLLLEKVEGGGLLAEHLAPVLGSAEARAHIEAALGFLGELGERLGDEVALAVALEGSGTGTHGKPVLYAEARRPVELAEFLPGFVARVNGAAGKQVLRLSPAEPGSGIVLTQVGDFLAVSEGPAVLDGSFAGTDLHTRLSASYASGVYQLLAVDLGAIVSIEAARDTDATRGDMLARLGVNDAEALIVTRNVAGDVATARVELGFSHERRGVAAWLAEPAPMGSLDFISANATLAAAVVIKEPSLLVDELFTIFRSTSPDFDAKLAELQSDLGIDIRQDLAASLGGELALAVDGPLLPKPAIEVIAEVYDSGRLQAALEKLAVRASEALRREGKPGLAVTSTVVSGRTYHGLAPEGLDPWLCWTYEDGFLVAAPDRVLLDRALRTRASGATLRTSQAFLSRLPGDGPLDVSALVWQNVGPVLNTSTAPSLGYAWGEKDRVIFSATGEAGLMGLELPALLSLTDRRHQ